MFQALLPGLNGGPNTKENLEVALKKKAQKKATKKLASKASKNKASAKKKTKKKAGKKKPGLYANIHKAQERAKRGGRPVRKKGEPGAPTATAFKKSAKTAKKTGQKTGRRKASSKKSK